LRRGYGFVNFIIAGRPAPSRRRSHYPAALVTLPGSEAEVYRALFQRRLWTLMTLVE
jgi:hypothetical protein